MIESVLEFFGQNMEALIAIVALALTIQQGYENRRHSRLSLRPHLSFERTVSDTTPQIELKLTNNGVGPAFIQNFHVTLDGQLVKAPTTDFWTAVGRQLNIPFMWGGGTHIGVNAAICAGQTILVAAFRTVAGDRDPQFDNRAAHRELDRLVVTVEYISAYGEKFRAVEEKDV